MLWLALDTCLDQCAGAVVEDGRARAVARIAMSRGHAEQIAPLAADLMREAGATFGDLDAVAVTTGPGSFTGVRVGVAFARGLALARAIPVTGVTSLEVVARQAGEAGLRLAVHRAALGQVFAAAYHNGIEVLAPQRLDPDKLVVHMAAESGLVAGTAADLVMARLGDRWRRAEDDLPDPIALARLALERPLSNVAPHPTYLRPPDAKLPGGVDPWGDEGAVSEGRMP